MNLFLSEEKTNLGRQYEIDYAKVIAFVFMVLIHAWEEISYYECYEIVPTSFLHNLLQFGAGPLAAPLFMFAMGIGICYSKHRSPKVFFKRGLNLFICGYLLNICRETIFYCISYIVKKNVEIDMIIYTLLNGDIFHFAGLTFMLVALLKKYEMPVLAMGGLSIIMQLIGCYLSLNVTIVKYMNYVYGLFFYAEKCCFPLLQWFIYPVSGIIFAKYLRHVTDKNVFYKYVLKISVILFIVLCVTMYLVGYDIKNMYILKDDVFYKQDFLHSLFTILVILIELSILYFVSINIKSNFINRIITYISNNLNNIYVIQWMLVGITEFIILMFDIDYFNAAPTILLGIVFCVLSVIISKIYNKSMLKRN